MKTNINYPDINKIAIKIDKDIEIALDALHIFETTFKSNIEINKSTSVFINCIAIIYFLEYIKLNKNSVTIARMVSNIDLELDMFYDIIKEIEKYNLNFNVEYFNDYTGIVDYNARSSIIFDYKYVSNHEIKTKKVYFYYTIVEINKSDIQDITKKDESMELNLPKQASELFNLKKFIECQCFNGMNIPPSSTIAVLLDNSNKILEAINSISYNYYYTRGSGVSRAAMSLTEANEKIVYIDMHPEHNTEFLQKCTGIEVFKRAYEHYENDNIIFLIDNIDFGNKAQIEFFNSIGFKNIQPKHKFVFLQERIVLTEDGNNIKSGIYTQ